MLASDASAEETSREARRHRRRVRTSGERLATERPRWATRRSRDPCDHELLRLAVLAALRDGDLGDRAVRQRGTPRGSPGSSGRAASRTEMCVTAMGIEMMRIHELLRLALLAALLRNGDLGDRQSVRDAPREGRRDERRESLSDLRNRDGDRDDGDPFELRLRLALLAALSQRGFWRSAVGQRGTPRGPRGTRRDDRQEALSDLRDRDGVEATAVHSGEVPGGSCGRYLQRGFRRAAAGQRGTPRRRTRTRQDERRDSLREAHSRWGSRVIGSGITHC